MQIGGDDYDTSRRNFATAAAARREKVAQGRDVGDGTPIGKLRKACLARGASGIKGLGRTFRIYDDDGNRSLSQEELKEGLNDYGVTVTQEELTALFEQFDKNSDGNISFDEFLLALRGPMSESRVRLINAAFAKLDADGSGVITVQDIAKNYDHKKHPKYQTGQFTAKQVYEEFLKSFDSPTDPDSRVTKEEFMNYYAGVSASVDSDAYFDLMMRNSWKL